ncbi:MAG: phage tail protein [Clostridiales bacterium]|nr:phage tail protein [Clostridiales bacterium]
MLSFIFGDKDSFNDYGIKICSRPKIVLPKKRVTEMIIPGRDSAVKFDENTYEDINISVECNIMDKDLSNKIDDIKSWLIKTGTNDLIFSYQPNKKYIAYMANSIDFSQILKVISRFVIIFRCEPFKYETKQETINVVKPEIIVNPGTIYSKPIIKVKGTGNIELKINSQIIEIENLDGVIILDSILEDAYNEEKHNMNFKINGEFPILEEGENNILWTGGISNIEITPNWRWI